MQHLEGVACTVADGQYHMVGGDAFAAGEHYAAHLSVVNFDIVHPALETDLTAERLDCGAHFFHHAHQPEGADVRLAHIQNFRRCAGLDEFRQAPFCHNVWDP